MFGTFRVTARRCNEKLEKRISRDSKRLVRRCIDLLRTFSQKHLLDFDRVKYDFSDHFHRFGSCSVRRTGVAKNRISSEGMFVDKTDFSENCSEKYGFLGTISQRLTQITQFGGRSEARDKRDLSRVAFTGRGVRITRPERWET